MNNKKLNEQPKVVDVRTKLRFDVAAVERYAERERRSKAVKNSNNFLRDRKL